MNDEPEGDVPLEVMVKHLLTEMRTIRKLVGEALFDIREAEAEIPEKIRRFMNYMHDVHDIKFMYEELGHDCPDHVKEELQRLDDRYKHLLKDLHTGGGAFEKVRQDMASRPGNRWDHTKRLTHHKEVKNGG